MSQQPLKIKNSIGWNYNVTLEDVLETKKRLKKIGHYEVPDYGLTPYPDRALFDGIKGFQKNAGLKVDGIMKPGGPTERTLNETLLASAADGGEKPAGKPLFGKNLLSMDAPTKKPKPQNRQLAMMPQKDKYAHPGIDGILEGGGGVPRGAISGNSLLKALGGALAAKVFQETAAKKLPGGSEAPPVPANSNTAKTKMDAALKLPPLPGYEPPARDPKDNKEEYPAEGPKVINRTEFPDLDKEEPQVFIFPDESEQYNKPQIMEERREHPRTKSQLDELRGHYIGLDYEVLFGGRTVDGEEVPELHIKGPAGDIKIPGTDKYYDSRPGSLRPDLVLKSPSGKILLIQTVDVDKNGKPSQREWDAAYRMHKRTGVSVILVPKTWQLEKRGLEEKDSGPNIDFRN